VIKFLSKAVPKSFPILGGDFGPRENNICQTAAMASGGLSNVFVSAFPALYQLKLLGATPKEDYLNIVALAAVSGYFGFFFATPRKFTCYTPRHKNQWLNERSSQVFHRVRCT
jgi:uncharacterized oligopeptide transporter (OPT) family protein